jgi:hypothetical protein
MVVRGAVLPRDDGGFAQDYRIEGSSPVEGRIEFRADGSPQSLTYRLAKAPIFVNAFEGRLVFGSTIDDSLVVASMGFRVEMRFILIVKRISGTIDLTECRRLAP